MAGQCRDPGLNLGRDLADNQLRDPRRRRGSPPKCSQRAPERVLGAGSATEEPYPLSARTRPRETTGTEAAAATVRPADLRRWVDELPYANREAVLGSLNEELSLLNAASVKPSVRFELLELHAGAYVRLLNSLIQRQGNSGVSALQQQRRLADMARKLTLQVADGYKQVVDATGSKKASLFASRRSDVTAIQRAFLFLCYSLNHSYEQYLPTEPRVWIELAGLHGLARERGALDRPGSHSEHRQEFARPISHLYKLALLTAVADPYHHGPGEVWKMFEFLGECADAAGLAAQRPAAGPEGVFVIDARGVERAWPLSHKAAGEAAKSYYLETNATSSLLENIREEVEQGRRDAFPTARARRQASAILSRIVQSLREPAQRSNDRTPIEAPVQLAVGISATQHLIGGTVAGTQATFGPGKESGARGAVSENDEDAVMKMIDPRSGGTVDVDVNKGRRRTDGSEGGADEAGVMAIYGSEPWDVTNKSRRGVGIVRRDPPRTPLCVGEIVSIATNKGASAIGLVRWFIVDEAGVHRAGIEIIGKRADSVNLRPLKHESNPDAARPALAMPFFGADEKAATLAALPGTYQEGGVLVVKCLETQAQVRVQMDSLIDATPSCERFTYRVSARK